MSLPFCLLEMIDSVDTNGVNAAAFRAFIDDFEQTIQPANTNLADIARSTITGLITRVVLYVYIFFIVVIAIILIVLAYFNVIGYMTVVILLVLAAIICFVFLVVAMCAAKVKIDPLTQMLQTQIFRLAAVIGSLTFRDILYLFVCQ